MYLNSYIFPIVYQESKINIASMFFKIFPLTLNPYSSEFLIDRSTYNTPNLI